MRTLRLTCLLVLLPVALPAQALRPFDGTDAAVADAGEFELEFGPLTRQRDGRQLTWLAPGAVANWGLGDDRELVLEGKRRRPDNSLVDAALSLKQIHRRGLLQGEAGASIASECGILLPGIRAEHGVGANCALIVSQHWSDMVVHFNTAIAYNRQHRWAPFLGVIVEGPDIGKIRPVMEVFVQKEAGEPKSTSSLAGLVWKHSESLSLDLGVRRAHSVGARVSELRLGFTWTSPRG